MYITIRKEHLEALLQLAEEAYEVHLDTVENETQLQAMSAEASAIAVAKLVIKWHTEAVA